MAKSSPRPSVKSHKHVLVTRYSLRQVGGLPYEVERTVCDRCGHVLDSKPLRRAAS